MANYIADGMKLEDKMWGTEGMNKILGLASQRTCDTAVQYSTVQYNDAWPSPCPCIRTSAGVNGEEAEGSSSGGGSSRIHFPPGELADLLWALIMGGVRPGPEWMKAYHEASLAVLQVWQP